MQPKTITEQLFFTTVQIDTITINNENCTGTGFIFSYTLNENKQALFIVANKHVVMNMSEGHFSFLKQKDGLPTLGDKLVLSIGQQDWAAMWFGHPDAGVDIAICPLMPLIDSVKKQRNIDLFFRAVGMSMIPTPQQEMELDATEIVTFIGYPTGIWDKKNFLPVARRGATSSPIQVDFNGSPCFLIDTSMFVGATGSPVFILDHGPRITKDGEFESDSRFYFVGVIARVFCRTYSNQIVSVPIPTQSQPITEQHKMIDLGVAFKARSVVETIEAFFKLKSHHMDTPAPASLHAPAAKDMETQEALDNPQLPTDAGDA
ncbi:MAG: serine protease [Betaproteobacteria bacterium]|nr:serine protease [Betaproteobacteria bacterium]